MNIELDEQTRKQILERAEANIAKNLEKQIMATFNIKQIAQEVKNLAIKQAVAEMSDMFVKKYKESSVVERAMQSAEDRVNKKVHELLKSGIHVKFSEQEPQK